MRRIVAAALLSVSAALPAPALAAPPVQRPARRRAAARAARRRQRHDARVDARAGRAVLVRGAARDRSGTRSGPPPGAASWRAWPRPVTSTPSSMSSSAPARSSRPSPATWATGAGRPRSASAARRRSRRATSCGSGSARTRARELPARRVRPAAARLARPGRSCRPRGVSRTVNETTNASDAFSTVMRAGITYRIHRAQARRLHEARALRSGHEPTSRTTRRSGPRAAAADFLSTPAAGEGGRYSLVVNAQQRRRNDQRYHLAGVTRAGTTPSPGPAAGRLPARAGDRCAGAAWTSSTSDRFSLCDSRASCA